MASTIAAIVYAVRRGPWLDEFWQLKISNPSLPFADAFHWWAYDIITPLFSAWNYWIGQFVEQDFSHLRMLNLVPLLALFAFCAYMAWRRPADRVFLAIVLILFASSKYFRLYFAEYRLYFMVMCLGTVLALGLYYLLEDRTPTTRERGVFRTAIVVALVLLVTLHFVAAASAGILTAVVALVVLRERRYGDFRFLAASMAVALVPSAVWAVTQFSSLAGRTGGNFWVQTTARSAVGYFRWLVTFGPGANIVIFIAAFIGFWAALPTLRRFLPHMLRGTSSPYLGEGHDHAVSALILWVGLAASFAFLLLVNFHTPIVIERYLLGGVGTVIVALAALGRRLVEQKRWVYFAVLANALAFSGWRLQTDVRPENLERWNVTAKVVRQVVEEHRSARVLAFEIADETGRARILDTESRQHYAYLASRHGFIENLESVPKETDDRIGFEDLTVFWSEHLPHQLRAPRDDPREFISETGLPIPAALASSAKLFQSDSGCVLIVDPRRVDSGFGAGASP